MWEMLLTWNLVEDKTKTTEQKLLRKIEKKIIIEGWKSIHFQVTQSGSFVIIILIINF